MKTGGEIKGRPGGWMKRRLAVFRGAAPGSEMGQGLFGSEGVAAVELGIILPLIMFSLIAVLELGRLAYFSIEVSNAAHAGAAYGAQSPSFAADNAGMRQAALNDGSNVTGLTAIAHDPTDTVVPLCECYPNTSLQTCGGLLPSNCSNRLSQYVQVTTSATVNCLVKYFGIPASYSLRGSATMRVAQ